VGEEGKGTREGKKGCDAILEVSRSEAARRLYDYCKERGVDVLSIALMTPLEVAELVDADVTVAERIVRGLRELLGLEAIRGGRLRDVIAARQKARVLKTRVQDFDERAGGLGFGLIYGFAGEYGTGKSMLAMQAAAYAAAEESRVVYIDTENAFSDALFGRILARACRELNCREEEAADRVELYQVADVYALQLLVRERLPPDVGVIVVDSIIEPFRAQFRGREYLQRRQQELHYTIDLLRRRALTRGTLVVLTNQVMSVPELFGTDRPAGGHVLLHNVNALFVMYRPAKTKLEGVMVPWDVPGLSPEVRMRYKIADDGLR
jgi:DNA repair protein RadA